MPEPSLDIALTRINDVFSRIPRPAVFVDPAHCCECAEHNATLAAHDPDTISLAELGRPSWDPICFVQDIDAFRYYLPALARLACGQGEQYYLSQLLFHLNGARINALSDGERAALAAFLTALTEAFPEEIDAARDTDTLLCTIAALQDTG